MILPDFLAPGLDIIFCGTAAGRISAQRGHYYANPGNRFWSFLAETGLTPQKLRPCEDNQINRFALGLTDLAKTAFGQDAMIPQQAWDAPGLWLKIVAQAPRTLAFTSLTAARLALGRPLVKAGQLDPNPLLPNVDLWALPSPSGLARSHFSAEPWHNMAIWVKAAR